VLNSRSFYTAFGLPLSLNERDGWMIDNPQVGRVLWPEFKAAVMEKNSPLCQGAEQQRMCDELRGLAHNYINRNGSAMYVSST
jgi:hypothetical protein